MLAPLGHSFEVASAGELAKVNAMEASVFGWRVGIQGMHLEVVVLGGGQRTASFWRYVTSLVMVLDTHADSEANLEFDIYCA